MANFHPQPSVLTYVQTTTSSYDQGIAPANPAQAIFELFSFYFLVCMIPRASSAQISELLATFSTARHCIGAWQACVPQAWRIPFSTQQKQASSAQRSVLIPIRRTLVVIVRLR
jgi:hypothetical protein